jgi:Domain of unknown function (DUF4265)
MKSATPSQANETSAPPVKIAIHLERNEDGFPPLSIELLNADQVSGDTFRIRNAPFFAPNVAYQDLVRARPSTVAGQFDLIDLVESSPFTCISIILLDATMDQFMMDLLRGMDCVIEYGEFGVYRVLAVAVPPSAAYTSLRATLDDLEARELISYAELCVAQ